jgi:S-adenosylmethionine uptake transporter
MAFLAELRSMSKPSPIQSLWILGATLSFSLMAVSVKYAAPLYSTAEILFYRSLMSAALIAAYAVVTRQRLYTPHWATHSRRAVFGTYSMGVWYYTLGVLPIATAVTLNYSSPIFVALLAAFFGWRARLSGEAVVSTDNRLLYLAIGAGFAGVVVLVDPQVSSDHVGASLLGLSAALAAAMSFRDVRKLIALGEPEWRLVFYLAANSALYAFIAMWFGTRHEHTLRGAGLLAMVAGFGTLGQLCLSRAFGRGHVLLAASLQYSGVVFAAIFGMLLWSEYPTLRSWIGIAIVAAAGVLATVSTRKPKPVIEPA